jgi:uncharacterized protein YggE
MHRPILSPLRFTASVAASLSILLALVASRARADRARADNDEPPASTIRVTGEGSVTSRPDRVELDLGVVTRAPSSEQAATENARVLQNVIAALRKVLGPKADIQTISYALQPDYQYPQGGPPQITGYTASNTVRVKADDLNRIGAVLDAATRAGANQVERIRFLLKDEDAAQAQALRIAVRDANAKAASLATTLGLQIVRVRSVIETSPTPRPMYDLEMAKAAAVTTPILPGAIETTATVTLTVEVANHRR